MQWLTFHRSSHSRSSSAFLCLRTRAFTSVCTTLALISTCSAMAWTFSILSCRTQKKMIKSYRYHKTISINQCNRRENVLLLVVSVNLQQDKGPHKSIWILIHTTVCSVLLPRWDNNDLKEQDTELKEAFKRTHIACDIFLLSVLNACSIFVIYSFVTLGGSFYEGKRKHRSGIGSHFTQQKWCNFLLGQTTLHIILYYFEFMCHLCYFYVRFLQYWENKTFYDWPKKIDFFEPEFWLKTNFSPWVLSDFSSSIFWKVTEWTGPHRDEGEVG